MRDAKVDLSATGADSAVNRASAFLALSSSRCLKISSSPGTLKGLDDASLRRGACTGMRASVHGLQASAGSINSAAAVPCHGACKPCPLTTFPTALSPSPPYLPSLLLTMLRCASCGPAN